MDWNVGYLDIDVLFVSMAAAAAGYTQTATNDIDGDHATPPSGRRSQSKKGN